MILKILVNKGAEIRWVLTAMIRMFLFLCILVLYPSDVSAWTPQSWNETKQQLFQRLINFDYAVPDYKVSRPNAKVMGWRLAKILQSLEKNYVQGLYNSILAEILNEQMGAHKLRALNVRKLKVLDIEKKDSVITILVHTLSKTKDGEKMSYDLRFTFVNSLSESEGANFLFSDLGRYIRKDE